MIAKTSWYNDAESILENFDLDKLYAVIEERAAAGIRGERLNEFIFCGYIHSLKSGKSHWLNYHTFRAKPVMTANGFDTLCRKNNMRLRSLWSDELPIIPHARIRCPECKKNWTIENIEMAVPHRSTSQFFVLTDYVGETMATVSDLLRNNRSDAIYEMPKRLSVYNIGELSLPSGILQRKALKVFNKNCRNTIKSVDMAYVIQQGDVICLHCQQFYHFSCYPT